MRAGKQLELEVREILDRALPASTLSGVCLFQPDYFGQTEKLGYEIDHLMHFSCEGTDHLVLIECKAQTVEFRGHATDDGLKQWVVRYINAAGETREKFLKSQLENQAKALAGSLSQAEGTRKIRVHGWVVSSDGKTPRLVDATAIQGRPKYQLFSLDAFREVMAKVDALANELDVNAQRMRPLRVMQSDILRQVRHGLIVPELGHPEVANGLRYVARCRERLDGELFRYFAPTKQGRWVINGAAGMGKTVLLAYAAAVFASDRMLNDSRDEAGKITRALVKWDHAAIGGEDTVKIGRKVVMLGLNPKQCGILEREFLRFREEFEQRTAGEAPFSRRPQVVQWRDDLVIDADVLLVDEAHDLSQAAQKTICEWWEAGKGRRYIVLACDRHQKLRLLGDQATVLEGMSFSGCSTRLTRNYRSPSPVYGAALALMFRWFGRGGSKVLPSRTELAQEFGFGVGAEVEWPKKAGETVRLELRNDSHPANYWSFTVARHTDWRLTYRWIEEWGLTQEQVLWLRFEHTDGELDHVGMSRVQMRDLCVHDPDLVIDAHIKGREFPVVVMEGLPTDGVDETQAEAMWRWRRRLYLCASRASCFLIFIYPGGGGSSARKAWNEELVEMLKSCSAPRNRDEASSKFWRMEFGYPDRVLKPDVFYELEGVVKKTKSESPVAAVVAGKAVPHVSKTVVVKIAPKPELKGSIPMQTKPKTSAGSTPERKACGMSPRMIAKDLKVNASTVLGEAKNLISKAGSKHKPSLEGDLSPEVVEMIYSLRGKKFPGRKEAKVIRDALSAISKKPKGGGEQLVGKRG